MPLTYGNLVVGNQTPELPRLEDEQKTFKEVRQEQAEKNVTSRGSFVVVDGKEKKISKHSAYLLDMLTIDEE